MATDKDEWEIPVIIVFVLLAFLLILVCFIVYCYWKKIWIFADTSSSSSSETYQSTTMVQQQDVAACFGGLNVLHIKNINSRPESGTCFSRPDVAVVNLLTIFNDPSDKQLVTVQPNRFRLYFHCAFYKNAHSPATYPHTSGQSGFARYETPLRLVEKGKYEIHAYAVVWKGPTPNAPPLPPANVTQDILLNYTTRFEFYVGVTAQGWRNNMSNSNFQIDIEDDDDYGQPNDGLNFGDFGDGAEDLLAMQKVLAAHFRPPPGTYVAPIDVHVSTTLMNRYKINISPQHMITADDSQMFHLSLTGNHIVKLVSRNPHVSRSIDMAAVYVLVPPPPDIVPNKGSITEVMPISISAPSCINNDVNLKHFYVVDGHMHNREPNQLYTNPFTVPCGEGNSERHCRIIARTVGRDGTQSEPTVADLQVLSSNVAIYDPSIPSPICLVAALEPRLLLQFNDGSHNHNSGDADNNYIPSDVVFYYRVVKDEMKRHMYSIEHDDSGFEGDDGRFKIYNPSIAIPINDSHCRIEAYAERISGDGGGPREQSIVAHYSWSESMAEAAHGQNDGTHVSASRMMSNANSRNHSRAVSPTTSGRYYRNDGIHAGQTLRPPIMSVVCSGATMAFEDPPHKNFVIRYSLDGAALDENWREFQSGTEVDVSEYLRAFGKIDVFARYYVEKSGSGNSAEPTRFGRSFSRDFTMPFFSGTGK